MIFEDFINFETFKLFTNRSVRNAVPTKQPITDSSHAPSIYLIISK